MDATLQLTHERVDDVPLLLGFSGLFLAGDIHPGNAADDPLYLPLYRRVRGLLGQTGLLYAGDCKMAALETRARSQPTGTIT